MTIGEYFIFGFISIVFILGIYFGVRLYKWNQRDMKRKSERNMRIKQNKKTKD